MRNFDFLIKEKNEDTDFDAKAIPYKPEAKIDFLKDVMSMANADITLDRYIVLGVKIDKKTGERNLIGIEEKDILDSADYQNWIHDFIEPDIDLNFFLYSFEGKKYGIFQIRNCSNPPYIMKKNYNYQKNGQKTEYLNEGEAWIRKNTKQNPMKRADFENIYEKRWKDQGFSGDVKLVFSDTNSDVISLRTIDEMILPSKRDYEKIAKIIDRKKEQLKNSEKSLNYFFTRFGNIFWWVFSFDRKYLKMNLEELVELQGKILENYSEDDYALIFGLMANRFNISIENLGEEYIEDASIKLIFPTMGVALSNYKSYGQNKLHLPKITTLGNPWNYYIKDLTNLNGKYGYSTFEISREIGDIKHKIHTNIFPEPLKLSLNKSMNGKAIIIKCILYGKNLREPIYRELTLKGGDW